MLSSVNTAKPVSANEDTKRHTLRVLLVVFLALLVLCTLFLYLESIGSGAAEFADRAAVKSYLRKHYGAEAGEFTVRFTGYDQLRERYTYECDCGRGTFKMTCKRFKVRYDGYFDEFLCSRGAEAAVDAYIKQYFAANWSAEDKQSALEINASIRVPEASEGAYLTDGGYDIARLLTDFGGTVELEATLRGGRIAFEPYKNLAYDLLNTMLHYQNDLTFMALSLFKDPDFMTPEFERNGYYSTPDFVVLGKSYGLEEKAVCAIIGEFGNLSSQIEDMVRKSLLSANAQEEYLRIFHDRLAMFR